jgi:hypothetical protein
VYEGTYNPFMTEGFAIDESKTNVTLYHDSVQGAKNFDGNDVKGSENKPALSIDTFHTNTVLAGDIHLPKIYERGAFKFSYCSSAMPRDFGEGDYYSNTDLYQHGALLHGCNDVVLHPDGTSDITFVPFEQYATYNTFYINDKLFDLDMINALTIANPGKYQTHVNVVAEGNITQFMLKEADIGVRKTKKQKFTITAKKIQNI